MALICKKFAVATVVQYGATDPMGFSEGCATSPSEGPLVATSAHICKGIGHDPCRAATRGGKKQPQQIKETKAKNQLLYYEKCIVAK